MTQSLPRKQLDKVDWESEEKERQRHLSGDYEDDEWITYPVTRSMVFVMHL
jgi:hypothetical protein